FQPRVGFETLGHDRRQSIHRNPEGVAMHVLIPGPSTHFPGVASLLLIGARDPQGFKANPGLELANAFSVVPRPSQEIRNKLPVEKRISSYYGHRTHRGGAQPQRRTCAQTNRRTNVSKAAAA